MARSLTHRRTASIVAAALVLGIATPPADARPNDAGSAGSSATALWAAAPASAVRLTTGHAAGGISDWGYVAIGSGVAALVLTGSCGTLVVSRRRRQHQAAMQSTIAG